MKSRLIGSTRKPRKVAAVRLLKVAGDTVASVDHDIEAAVDLLQKRHGYTRALASAELVRKLSFAA